MAQCKKCDRCGKMYENYTKYSTNKKDMNGIAGVCCNECGTAYLTTKDMIFDLCDECLASFKNWWDEDRIVLSDECVEEFEREKNGHPDSYPADIIIQEPESDGDKNV